MALIQSTAIPSGATDYELEQSLKFNDDDSAYLSRTFASAGNRRTFTLSMWFKLGNLGVAQKLWTVGADSSNKTEIEIGSSGIIWVEDKASGSAQATFQSTQLLRDTSAWYHLIVAVDTTQGTAANRVKIYLNGNQVTDFTTYETYPDQNDDWSTNTAAAHYLGKRSYSSNYYDGYLGEVNFIDGSAKAPADFGETGDYGEWKPKAYSGSYGTNGFYLPFKQDYTVEGMSTVTYTGTGANQYIGGTGFQPDFTWIKERSSTSDHSLHDSVRGSTKILKSSTTAAEITRTESVTAFNNDGFTVDANNGVNESGQTYVAWNWDMGGSNATNTAGSIQSTVRANATYGQSIVSYTGNSSGSQSVGHGLSSAPEMVFVKSRDSSSAGFLVRTTEIDDSSDYLELNLTNAKADSGVAVPSSTVVNLGTSVADNTNTQNYIMYCFHSVTGYSKIGTYTGNGSANHAITGLGFEPAFLLIKRTNSAHDWVITDNTRNPNEPLTLLANTSDAESNQDGDDVTSLDSDGFTVGVNARVNGNNDTYIYMAFADKREYAYWLDQSGNNNDWTSNNLTESDISVDSPTNNFATWNPLNNPGGTFSEGNLKWVSTASDARIALSSFTVDALVSLDSYCEILIGAKTGVYWTVGIFSNPQTWNPRLAYRNDGEVWVDGSSTQSGVTTYTEGDIMGLSYNVSSGVCKIYKNNSLVVTETVGDINDVNYFGCASDSSGSTSTYIANFGQDSSFAGNKTAQGNQDGNDIGDFYYTPPTGYLALCTSNLPDVAVVPSEHFNTVLYSGNGSTQSITGVGFQPDFTWFKNRNSTQGHELFDVIRGVASSLRSHNTDAENTDSPNDRLTSFDSDGFSLGADGNPNNSSNTYVAWNWKANGSGSSNTDGSITSTVSANVDAGFSIVSYTGNATNDATIGHGLSKAPDLMIVKSRDGADAGTHQWYVYEGTSASLYLESTEPLHSDNRLKSAQATTFTVSQHAQCNASGDAYIGYMFHSVEGYSKVGHYTGNGNADGTFVYTGFRPAFILLKQTTAVQDWQIYDVKRSPTNLIDDALYPNTSAAEATANYLNMDIVSNGFKVRAVSGANNVNNGTYVYLAFAETPFKFSNAR